MALKELFFSSKEKEAVTEVELPLLSDNTATSIIVHDENDDAKSEDDDSTGQARRNANPACWEDEARPISRKVVLATLAALSLTGLLAWFGTASFSPAAEWARTHLDALSSLVAGYGSSASSLNGQVVYSDTFHTTLFPEPYAGFRWTTAHSGVVEGPVIGEHFLETLAFIEKEDDGPQDGLQVIPYPFEALIGSAECIYSDGSTSSAYSAQLPQPTPNLMLIRCHIPAHLFPPKVATSLALNLHFKEDGPIFTQNISLQTQVPKQRQQFSVCVPPIASEWDERSVLEWRTHYALLGIETVHWYYRPDANNRVLPYLQNMSTIMETRDTFTLAPPVSQVRYNVPGLRHDGVYVDKTFWYADCIARSRHTYPSEWVLLGDLDEYLLPVNASAIDAPSQIASFLDSHVDDTNSTTIGSICLSRSILTGPSILPANGSDPGSDAGMPRLALSSSELAVPLRVEEIFGEPTEPAIHCIHRSSLIEQPADGQKRSWRPPLKPAGLVKAGQAVQRIVAAEYSAGARVVPRLVHLSAETFGDSVKDSDPGMVTWVQRLAQEVEGIRLTMNNLKEGDT